MPKYDITMTTSVTAKNLDEAMVILRAHVFGNSRKVGDAIESIKVMCKGEHVAPKVDIDALKYRLAHRMDQNDPDATYEIMLAMYEHIDVGRWVGSFFLRDSDPWAPILKAMHEGLLTVDPDYELVQMKEKFHDLRVYVRPNKKYDEETRTRMMERMKIIVDKYETEANSRGID